VKGELEKSISFKLHVKGIIREKMSSLALNSSLSFDAKGLKFCIKKA